MDFIQHLSTLFIVALLLVLVGLIFLPVDLSIEDKEPSAD
jgi:hypothetical protein